MNLIAFLGFIGVSTANVNDTVNDVTIDPDNFYNFQTDVTIQVKKLEQHFGPLHGIENGNDTGHVQFNVDAQVVKISLTGRGDFEQSSYGRPTGVKMDGIGGGDFFLDMKNRKAVVRARANIDVAQMQAGVNYEFCVSVDLPPLPPQANPFLRMRPPPAEWQRLEGMVQQLPHDVEDDGIVHYEIPPNSHDNPYPMSTMDIDVTSDGIPEHVANFYTCNQECMDDPRRSSYLDRMPEVDVWFENWEQGAGDVDAIECAKVPGASTDLNAFPRAVQVLAAYDIVMQTFSEHATMGPLILQQIQLDSMSKSKSEADASSLVAAFVAGVSGAVLVLAAAGLLARKARKPEPLLSEA